MRLFATALLTACAYITAFSQSTEIIKFPPLGQNVVYEKSGTQFFPLISGQVVKTHAEGALGYLVFAGSDAIYIKNPIINFPTDSWIVGTVEGNTVTVKTPQTVYSELVDGVWYYYDVRRMVYDKDKQTYVVDANATDITFSMEEGQLTQTEGNVMLGLTDGTGDWTYYGDANMVYTPFTDQVVEMPAGLEMEKWAMTHDGGDGTFVSLGFSGNDIYIKGIDPDIPDACIKGTVEDGKVTFPSGQYLGPDEFYGYHFYYVALDNDYNVLDKLVFDYDADLKTMKSKGILSVNGGKTSANCLYAYEDPMFRRQADDAETYEPANPEITLFYTYSPTRPKHYLYFNLPVCDVEGSLLDSGKLYYNIYLDDEVLDFYPDEYWNLSSIMTDIPYGYTEGSDIKTDGMQHQVAIYRTGYDRIGVQLIYKDNGRELRSDIVYHEINSTGIEQVQDGEDAVSVHYTDLSGRRLTAPVKGLNIKTVTYSDGSRKSFKVAVE
ncbi:MAG: hypothetical protein ACI350_05225 [Prevotella sp.]